MKTIRQNVFETNSSSTHSVTIQTKGNPKTGKVKRPLVEGNTLYPFRLHDYSTSFGYDGSNLQCDTKDMKASIVYQWILDRQSNGDIEDDQYKEYKKYFQEKLGYLIIDIEGADYSDYSPYSEDGDFSFDLDGDSENDYEILDQMIANILNDNIIITDCDAPY